MPADFNESPAADALRAVVREVFEEFDREFVGRQAPDDVVTERVRQRILDRWYRFEAFGVRSRADLSALKVSLRDAPSRIQPDLGSTDTARATEVSVAGTDTARATEVSVAGTPLEGKL
jgi:hypothetical protein